MPQLLESTRNYLKSSTKLGRRMSSYRSDSSASEGSLHDIAPSNVENHKQQISQHRPSSHSRLSTLFTLEGRNRNSISSEDRAAVSVLSHKIGSEGQDQHQQDKKSKKRRNSSSRQSTQSQPESSPSEEVPRARSPTMSVAYTMRSAASSYDVRPDDYPSLDQYQAHVWRRNLLEESIMHSLNLGFGSHAQNGDGSRTVKRSATSRARKSRAGADVAPADVRVSVIDRSMTAPSGRILKPQHDNQGPILNKNSPYQMLNPSTTNITHSYASFTLELPEHQVKHVMSSSVTPNLFKIKTRLSESRSRHTGPSPSPRVLTGKPAVEAKENMAPHHALQEVAAAV
ncbi:hypothetical protein BGZ54_001294 [Gamsiella multidivaricata]|nr:hypothetical protein BGZ54_001294 [Gamsiella multidivaricata]